MIRKRSFHCGTKRGTPTLLTPIRCSPGVPFLHRSERGRLKVLLERMPLEGLCTRQLWALPYRQKIETSLSLSWSLSLSTQAQKRQKSLPWRGLSALSFYREGRALYTQHAKHTAGNTHRHRRAWGRGLENLANHGQGYGTRANTCSQPAKKYYNLTDKNFEFNLVKNIDYVSNPF